MWCDVSAKNRTKCKFYARESINIIPFALLSRSKPHTDSADLCIVHAHHTYKFLCFSFENIVLGACGGDFCSAALFGFWIEWGQ